MWFNYLIVSFLSDMQDNYHSYVQSIVFTK